MTEEQIKQNAWNDIGKYSQCDENEWIDGYVIGAHSCDGEANHWKESYEELVEIANDLQSDNQKLMIENAKLRNPWISGEKHPTDVTKDYLLEYEDGSYIVAIWDSGMWMSKDLHPLKEPQKWMHIPQNEKGE